MNGFKVKQRDVSLPKQTRRTVIKVFNSVNTALYQDDKLRKSQYKQLFWHFHVHLSTQAYRENTMPQAHILFKVQDIHQSFS